tara:strand:+ start:5428 stop:6078 length:651 start_codon:yes stop_codon:yes gene_type:complete
MKTKTLTNAIILTTLLLFFIPKVNAQSENEWGVKGGLNFSNFYNDEIDDQDMRVGYNFGLFFKAQIVDFLAIQPEVLYSTKGATTKYNNFLTGDAEFTQKLNYIEVPVLAVLNLTDNLNIHAGPYAAYLMNASIENEAENSTFDFVDELDESDFNRLDYGLAVGAGLEFDVIRFGARYNLGLSEIGDVEEDGNTAISNAFNETKNANFSLYVGLSF